MLLSPEDFFSICRANNLLSEKNCSKNNPYGLKLPEIPVKSKVFHKINPKKLASRYSWIVTSNEKLRRHILNNHFRYPKDNIEDYIELFDFELCYVKNIYLDKELLELFTEFKRVFSLEKKELFEYLTNDSKGIIALDDRQKINEVNKYSYLEFIYFNLIYINKLGIIQNFDITLFLTLLDTEEERREVSNRVKEYWNSFSYFDSFFYFYLKEMGVEMSFPNKYINVIERDGGYLE